MTNKSVFDFKNYKLYLKYIESIRTNSRRGFRASLAPDFDTTRSIKLVFSIV